jgi:hypothetical protein
MSTADEAAPPSALAAALARAGAAGVYRVSIAALPEIAVAAAQLGFVDGEVELAGCRNAASALAAVGRALAFPDWYGGNFDALNDCLGDFADSNGGIVLLRGYAALLAADPAAAEMLLAVADAVSEARRESAAPLWVLVLVADEDSSATSALPAFP